MRVHDAVVLGLGIHGSAAAYELAGRGLDVLGIDRFPPGHRRGSSHGATRMIRRAYPSEAWNQLVDDAYRGWERWARKDGAPFVHRTGGLYAHRGAASMQGGRSAPAPAAQWASLGYARRIIRVAPWELPRRWPGRKRSMPTTSSPRPASS